ncbi:MAG: methyltransferase [Bacilli bacterium]|nr:methyltransferase [Bacilli bacterium]
MSHYFDNDPNLKTEVKLIEFVVGSKQFSLFSDFGVFSKNKLDVGSETLLNYALSIPVSGNVLDIGCGIGTLGVVILKMISDVNVDMTDVNKRAVLLAKKNVEKYDLQSRAKVYVSNLYEKITNTYDFVLTNPPIRAGKKIIYEIFSGSFEHLSKNGAILVVIRKSHGAPSAQKKLLEIFGNCEIVKRNKGYYVLRSIKK